MYIAIIFCIGQLVMGYIGLGWGLDSIILYAICIGIAFILLKKDNKKFLEVVPFNVGLKPVTALLVVALVFLLMPIASFLGELGALLGGNMVQMFADQMAAQEVSFPEMLFSTAVVPAIFEELFFRGFLYSGYKKARGACFSIIMTGILFGFFHTNIQQIVYAVFFGFLLAVLREVTGSMWAGVIFHFVNNGWSLVGDLYIKKAPQGSFWSKLPLERVTFFGANGVKLSAGTLVFSILMAIGCTALAAWVLITIVKREGRWDDMKNGFFRKPDDPKERYITAPFIIGCVIVVLLTLSAFVYMKFLPLFQAFMPIQG